MTLTEARKKIETYTANGNTAYVTARIMHDKAIGDFILDPNGYKISDWLDDSCIECWYNGKNLGFPT